MISVFTPLSEAGNPYIREAFESLLAQEGEIEWEWVVLENNGGRLPDDIAAHPSVRRYEYNSGPPNVGALKMCAAGWCKGEILLELDHDDMLAPGAFFEVNKAIQAGADFVFSDFAEFHTGTWEPNVYGSQFGWRSYPVTFLGHDLLAMKAPVDPIAWRRIEWAPNHLRAWRRSTYQDVGGHDPSLRFADDHDLVLRTYLSGAKCQLIKECLYFYRVHERQNVKLANAEIQELAAGTYDKYVYRLAEHSAKQRGLLLVDLCGGVDCPDQYAPIDRQCERKDGIVCDLDGRWALEDSSVGVLRAFDALEHLSSPIQTMNEAWRVLAPGGMMLVMVPSTDAIVNRIMGPDGKLADVEIINGRGAYCDPTHVSFWNELSFRYYTNEIYRRYLLSAGLTARFAASRVRTVNCFGIPYVQAELICLKGDYHPMGQVLCPRHTSHGKDAIWYY